MLCAYPSSRRSRNTQPTNVDPFIDNLSQLEARILKIENDLESQRTLVQSVCSIDDTLYTRVLQTEKELYESRSIVAQLRLRGEQRVKKRAAKKPVQQAAVKPAAGVPYFDWSNAFVDPMIIATAQDSSAFGFLF